MTLAALEGSTTLAEAFAITARQAPDQPALRALDGSLELSWREYEQRALTVARGYVARGLQRGDVIALMLGQRPEFNVCDSAALLLGITPFSIYNTSSPEQIAYMLDNSKARIVITEPRFLEQVLAAGRDLPIVLVEGEHERATTLAALEAAGGDGELPSAPTADDLALLIYTSGTTGRPKGVELTHANVLAQWRGIDAAVPVPAGGIVLAYLPAAHIADRLMSHYLSIVSGSTLVCCPEPQAAIAAMPEVRPTFFMTVPRIWEKLKAALDAGGGEPLREAVERAVRGDATEADEQLFAALRARLGLDRATQLFSGAAPISAHVLNFFGAIGLPVREGLGMSEAGTVSVNPADDIRPGTIGKALPNYEVRLADDGELLVRSPGVMRGYRGDPEQTAAAIDADGWLHTGDVATIDDDGFITIVDRKKELIISAAGKNMSPVHIEHTLKAASPLIGQACVVGDGRPYNVALIVTDPDVAQSFDGDVLAAVEQAVEVANERLARVEQVKRFVLLDTEWLPDSEQLTPTMKLKRRGIAAVYADDIEALYASTDRSRLALVRD